MPFRGAARLRRLAPAALAALLLLRPSALGRDDQPLDLRALWNDPTFQKQFVAGYGVNAEIEPRVAPDEVKTLEAIRPLMAEDLAGAEAELLDRMKPGCSAMLDYTLASIQFQLDRYDEARANYEKAVEKFPSFRRAWRNLGLIHAHDGRHDEAVQAFTRMITLGGGDGYSYGLLGFAYSGKHDEQAAETAFRNALLLQPESTDWRLGLAQSLVRQQKFGDAISLLDVLIERFPDKADFWKLQASTYLAMKQPLKAAQDFEALDMLGQSSVDTLNTLGEVYVSESLMDLALGAFLRAIDLDAGQPVTRPLRAAEVLAAHGALPQARLVAQHIHAAWDARLTEDDRRKLLKLESRLSMADGGGGSAETAKVLEEIIAMDPLDGDALLLLGQYHARQNEPDRAMFCYERAESLPDFEARAKIRHAQVLVSLSRYADAVPLLRRALEVTPSDDIARYLEQVERIAKARR
ncbi:MAG TPA: tetratricopeptide repeat protein [Planctomycetota bacterium]|nr:tetratricopeptide repeat protein [Planctomycetota bacterium]